MTAALSLLAAETESGVDLPVPAWALGLATFLALCLLLLVTLTFGKDR